MFGRPRSIWGWLFLVLAIAGLPMCCCPVLMVVNSVNPMALAFLVDIEVANETDDTLFVTPIGAVGAEGRRSVLPQYTGTVPAFPAFRTGDFRLEPGESVSIRYDWDDINISEIAVRNEEGAYRALIVDPTPTVGRYHPPTERSFTIDSFEDLAGIDPQVLKAAREGEFAWGIWGFIASSIVPFVLLVIWWMKWGKELWSRGKEQSQD
jgi:hypothetical protein